MRVIETSDLKEALDILGMEEEIALIGVHKRPLLCTGRIDSSDLHVARALGYDIATVEHLGGTIICSPGDISFAANVFGDPVGTENRFLDAMLAYLSNFSSDVVRSENDILLDGKKVTSAAGARRNNGFGVFYAHCSVNTNLDMIRRLCTKKMVKVPGRLADYDVPIEELKKVFLRNVLNEKEVLNGYLLH